MSNIPFLNPKPVSFRTPTSSEEYNQTQEEVFYDISHLFNLANTLEEDLQLANEAFELNNQFQNLYIRQLELRVLQLEENIDALLSNVNNHTVYAFPEDMKKDETIPKDEQANIDTLHRIATLPITGKRISKVYIYNEVNNEIVIPSALKVQVFPESKPGWIIKENSPIEAFNGNNTSYWHRKIVMPMDDTPELFVTSEMVVTLPDTMISNRDINTIYIHPFPLNGLTIQAVEYRVNGDYKLIPGWPVDENGEAVPYHNAGNLLFSMPNTQMSQIRIKMMQPHWFEENHQKVYHFGLQEVGVFYVDYQSEFGHIDIPISLKETGTKVLKGLTPKFANEYAISNPSSVFTYEIYTIDEFGEMHYTKEAFPILVNENNLLIRATIHADPYTKVSPALESIELNYETV